MTVAWRAIDENYRRYVVGSNSAGARHAAVLGRDRSTGAGTCRGNVIHLWHRSCDLRANIARLSDDHGSSDRRNMGAGAEHENYGRDNGIAPRRRSGYNTGMHHTHKQSTAYFAPPGSIAREIWGNSDTMLVVFTGSAAEFALNKAVDWLFFTGKLPHDPIGRLFSTARFAQEIMFADTESARRTIDRIGKIHGSIERQRGAAIPDWSYRDVLYMLMDYGERAYTLLYRPLTPAERDELYAIHLKFGQQMGVRDLPTTYAAWQIDRQRHLERDLAYSNETSMMYAQYRRHLGPWRYDLLLQIQALIVPDQVARLLKLTPQPRVRRSIKLYRKLDQLGLRPLVQRLLLPPQYLNDVRRLDQPIAA